MTTPEEKKQRAEFTFDEDGVTDAVAWMNDRLFEDRELWQDSGRGWDQYDHLKKD